MANLAFTGMQQSNPSLAQKLGNSIVGNKVKISFKLLYFYKNVRPTQNKFTICFLNFFPPFTRNIPDSPKIMVNILRNLTLKKLSVALKQIMDYS